MEEKRLQIMQAAEALFKTRRFHEITTDDVADRAGVGKGTIYRYFKDKDDLFYQTASHGLDELCRLLAAGVDGQDFRSQLNDAARRISEFFESRRQLFRMIGAEENRFQTGGGRHGHQWRERRMQLVRALAAILQRGVAEGHLRPEVPPEVLAAFLLGMLRTQFRSRDDLPEGFRDHAAVIDLFWEGAGREREVRK